MLAACFDWWLARIRELVPPSWKDFVIGPSYAIVAEADPSNTISVALRRRGRCGILTASLAFRLRARVPVLLRISPDAALHTVHVMPAAPRKDIDRALRYELERITPFKADELFWQWQGRPNLVDKRRVIVSLTLVPRTVIATTLEALASAGLQPDLLEVVSREQPCLLATGAKTPHATRYRSARALAWACTALVAIGLTMPVLLQEYELRGTNNAIAQLQPTTRHIDALRQGLAAAMSERQILAAEAARTGGLVRLLAKLTDLLPDDTFLMELSLRDRQLLFSGRSAAAASLIPTFFAETAFHDAAFAAPVTHTEGATGDLFTIQTNIAP